MKRLTLLTILLVVVGLTAGFALEVKPSFELSGSATAKWGYNLLTGNNGFENSADLSLTVSLFPEDSTDAAKGDGAWYGWIEISNIEVFWTADEAAGFAAGGDGDALDASAHIVGLGGALEIGIYAEPSMALEYAGYVPLFSEDDGYDDTGAVTPDPEIMGGISVAYTLKDIGTVTVNVASNGDWGVTDASADTVTYSVYLADGTEVVETLGDYKTLAGVDVPVATTLTAGTLYFKAEVVAGDTFSGNDQYTFGGMFALSAVKDLTFEVAGFYNLETEMLGFGGKAGYAISGISANVGFDGVYAASTLNWDLAASLGYAFMEDKDSVSLDAYLDNADLFNLGLLFKDAEGFMKGLSVSLGAYLYDVMAAQTISFGESVDYKFMLGDVNYVKPYEKVCYDVDAKELYLNVGVELMLFPKTTFTIDFAGGETADDNNASLVGTDISGYQVLSISTTISY